MTQNPQKQPKRRILALRAIYPCETISPATLLRSLLSLAGDVALRKSDPDSYPTNRRAIREATRIAGLLLVFLEDVCDSCGSGLPDSVVLPLSELHVALQKIRLLLKDCSKEGARLWILMKSDLVASEFRVLIGSVATVLDVLPLDAIEAASPEAKELARLLTLQATRPAIAPDPEDDLAARSVRSILDQFKNGVAPDARDVRRVLDRLRIRSWSDCAEEIDFLDAELFARLEDGDEDDNDVVLASSLMAFMVYCCVVLFDHVDGNKSEARKPMPMPGAARCTDWINPATLRCPITLELMTDPVTIATGQTYDRASIKKWVKTGCPTCPVTGEKLRTTEFVSNAALRRIVEDLLLSNGVVLADSSSSKHRHAVDQTASPFSLAAAGATRLAVLFLVGKLSRGTVEEKRKASYEARKLSKHSVFHRACLVEADAVPWLLYLLSSPEASTQDNAVAALLNLSKHPGGRGALFEAGGVGLIIDVINVGLKVEAQQNAAAILFYLSSVPEYCEEIGRMPEAMPTLVELMREGGYRGLKNAVVSLYGLLRCPHNHAKVVAAGAVPVLASLLSSEREDLVKDSVGLLARIAERPEGAMAVLESSALVTRLVEFLSSSTSRSGKDHCVSLLLSLCKHGGDSVVGLLGKMPGLMTSLYSLLVDGTPQVCKKARSLLNQIHLHFDRNHPAVALPLSGERVIRALYLQRQS